MKRIMLLVSLIIPFMFGQSVFSKGGGTELRKPMEELSNLKRQKVRDQKYEAKVNSAQNAFAQKASRWVNDLVDSDFKNKRLENSDRTTTALLESDAGAIMRFFFRGNSHMKSVVLGEKGLKEIGLSESADANTFLKMLETIAIISKASEFRDPLSLTHFKNSEESKAHAKLQLEFVKKPVFRALRRLLTGKEAALWKAEAGKEKFEEFLGKINEGVKESNLSLDNSLDQAFIFLDVKREKFAEWCKNGGAG